MKQYEKTQEITNFLTHTIPAERIHLVNIKEHMEKYPQIRLPSGRIYIT